jgi:hypothetical protein
MRPALVVVSNNFNKTLYTYTRYVDGKMERQLVAPEPLNPEWVEVIRDAPEFLEAEDQDTDPPEGSWDPGEAA